MRARRMRLSSVAEPGYLHGACGSALSGMKQNKPEDELKASPRILLPAWEKNPGTRGAASSGLGGSRRPYLWIFGLRGKFWYGRRTSVSSVARRWSKVERVTLEKGLAPWVLVKPLRMLTLMP